jgi:hypothetical protein
MVFPRVSHLFPPDAVVTRNEWPVFCPLVRMACCRCCEKTGACCNDGVCTQETCADCEDLGGVFQGADTACGEDDECPCDPPADPGQCQKCVDGEVTGYCPEARPNCCDGVCQAEPCGGLGACCDDDGTCSQTTEGDCSGAWHEGVDCDDIDCTSGCCEGVTSPNGNCFYNRCVRGETDGCGSPCDPDEPQPEEPVPDCDGGTPASVTVTGSGYVANSGDPALDAALEAIMNDSYNVDLLCNGSGQLQLTSGPYLIQVVVGVSSSRSAAISLNDGFGIFASMSYTPGSAASSVSTDCSATIYTCSGYSGAPQTTSGVGDFSGADIDVSV